MTELTARQLADEYLRLGGLRRVVIDDNETSARSWHADPPVAEEFWRQEIETLDKARQREVLLLLPDIDGQ